MTIYDRIDSNKRRSVALVGFFLIFVILIGWLFSAYYNSSMILWIAVTIAIVQALVSYYSGDKIALSMSGARQIEKKDNPTLWNTVENLSITAGLPMPKVYIISDPAPNAFATGRDPEHSSIAVTTGLLERLDKPELQGVIAHELSHVGNYDIRLMMIVVVLVGIISIISDFFLRTRFFGSDRKNEGEGNSQFQLILLVLSILAAILAPLAATIIQLAISRKREFLADSSGALMTRYPDGLASALEKISQYKQPMAKTSKATAHLFISTPMGFSGKKVSKLFSTHPPIEERIVALRAMNIG